MAGPNESTPHTGLPYERRVAAIYKLLTTVPLYWSTSASWGGKFVQCIAKDQAFDLGRGTDLWKAIAEHPDVWDMVKPWLKFNDRIRKEIEVDMLQLRKMEAAECPA